MGGGEEERRSNGLGQQQARRQSEDVSMTEGPVEFMPPNRG
jgi:hypothetical protein